MDYSICPCCNSNDAVQRVATIVDEGTSEGITVGASVMLNQGINGVMPGIYGSVNKSRLAQRLSPYSIAPGNVQPWVFFAGYIALTAWSTYFLASRFSPNLIVGQDIVTVLMGMMLWFFPGMMMGAVVEFVIYVIWYFTMSSQRRDWMRAARHLRSSYYCFRDDVVFDDVDWASPEDFVPYVFNK